MSLARRVFANSSVSITETNHWYLPIGEFAR